jgi:hypothetical protein
MVVVVLEGGWLLRKEMAPSDYTIEDGVTRQVRDMSIPGVSGDSGCG